MSDSIFSSIEDALEDIREGKMVIVVDDPDRENEGDLVMAAEKVTPEAINFMAKYGRGLICLTLTPERCEELDLHPMTTKNTDPKGTYFCVSIDAHPKYGTTTGISAFDRAITIKLAVSPDAKPSDFIRPGHVFPLKAKPGGVLERAGHTEASVDLARLAGLYPAGVICEIMNEDGTMARLPDLIKFAKRFNLKIITIADLIRYRLKKERIVVFKSLRCDCRDQLEAALMQIAEEGKGVLVYIMGHEGRGIGIVNKIKAYSLQDKGYDTVEANEKLGYSADLRDYGVGAQILLDLGVRKMRLLTNNPRKIVALEGYGLEVVERVPLKVPPCEHNERYLQAKKNKLGHLL
jgi:3,4-dihydroxy 2-butanone 4-phosphate synthase/GTP cyclohydrolase II